jgi:hypothetical protein
MVCPRRMRARRKSMRRARKARRTNQAISCVKGVKNALPNLAGGRPGDQGISRLVGVTASRRARAGVLRLAKLRRKPKASQLVAGGRARHERHHRNIVHSDACILEGCQHRFAFKPDTSRRTRLPISQKFDQFLNSRSLSMMAFLICIGGSKNQTR